MRMAAREVVRLRALRGEARAFRFKTDAQFENGQHVAQRGGGHHVDAGPESGSASCMGYIDV
jgi:uncharacterized protein (DUF2126 family)